MKLPCRVNNKPGLIVGYCQGKRGKVRAIVITSGELKDFALKDIELKDLPEDLKTKLIPIIKGVA